MNEIVLFVDGLWQTSQSFGMPKTDFLVFSEIVCVRMMMMVLRWEPIAKIQCHFKAPNHEPRKDLGPAKQTNSLKDTNLPKFEAARRISKNAN